MICADISHAANESAHVKGKQPLTLRSTSALPGGRRAKVVELDPRFCDVIVRRWELLKGQPAVRVAAAQAA